MCMIDIDTLTDKEEYKIIRKRKHITLKNVADYINADISVVCRWENNKRNMTQEQVKKYIEFITNKNIKED